MFEFKNGQVTRDNETNFREVERLVKFFWNLKGQITHENEQVFEF
jgi:hypothetical protein